MDKTTNGIDDIDLKISEAMEGAGLFFSILKSMKIFNDQEIKGVVCGQFKPTPIENCFLLAYLRAVENVDSMLELAHVKHFQAIANLARTMLELAADAHLLSKIPDAVQKFLAFNQLERLRAARGILKFESNHKLSIPFDDSSYKRFVDQNATSIEDEASVLWPKLKVPDIKHWTALNLQQRCARVGEPLEEIYELYNRILSWYVHSGGSGAMGLPAETFPLICSLGYRVAAFTFEEVIKEVAKAFKLHLAIESINERLEYAKALPLTSGPEQELKLAKELGLM